MASSKSEIPPARPSTKLPIGSLLILAAAGFLTAMLEALPAGILPALSADLGVPEAAAGQTITLHLAGLGPDALPWATLALLLPALILVVAGHRHAFLATRHH